MKRTLYLSVGIAFIGGLILTYFAVLCWAYIGAHTPVLRWLVDLGLRGSALRVVLFPIDFLTNVVLSLPLAFVLVRLQPRKILLFLAVAIIPSFVWLNLPLLGNEFFHDLWPSFALAWLHSLFALPVAVWLAGQFAKPGAPNTAMHPTCEDARE